MAAPTYHGYARRVILVNGVRGYNAGDGLTESACENLGLTAGVDYDLARPELLDRPAVGARKRDWVDYAVARGMDPDEADELTRDQLAEQFPADAPSAAEPAPDTTAEQVAEQTGQPSTVEDLGDDVPTGNVADVLAWVGDDRTRAVMALQAEQARDKPRSGVVDPLSDMLDDEG